MSARMPVSKSDEALTYRASGVDIAAADAFAARIRELARNTHGPEVLPSGDAYAGLFRAPLAGLNKPLIAATCDGVGTKLIVARECGSYRGLGQDLVAMNVNDLLPRGARPLFFLDYLAIGSIRSAPMLELAEGIAAACSAAGCALLGGETAEMPDVYKPGDFDLAGFAVGIVDEAHVPREDLSPGDVVLGLPSSGVHSNGFSLVRRVLEHAGVDYRDQLPELTQPIGAELLIPTRLYIEPVLTLLRTVRVKAAAHVTGGGLLGRARKLARDGLHIDIDPSRYTRPPIFSAIARLGSIPDDEMARTFNMGLGFLAIVSAADADELQKRGLGDLQIVGQVTAGTTGVDLGYAAA